MSDQEQPNGNGNKPVVFNEAPVVIFTKLYRQSVSGDWAEFNVTVRAGTIEEAFDTMFKGIASAQKEYHVTPTRTNGNAAPPAPAAPGAVPPPPAGAPVAPPAPLAANGVPPATAGGNIHATKLEIIPVAGGKVTLKWYAEGHQYPDITATGWTAERALQMLAPTGAWTAQHFAAAQTVQVQHAISYKNSEKLSSSGKPYKDIVAITAG